MLPSHRDTAPAIPARLVRTQWAHRPGLAVCASPVRTCLARTKNWRARSIRLRRPPAVQAFLSSARENGVREIARTRSSGWLRSTSKKFTSSSSMSLYVSTGEGSRFIKTAADPPKTSQKCCVGGSRGSNQSKWLNLPPYQPNAICLAIVSMRRSIPVARGLRSGVMVSLPTTGLSGFR